MSKMLRFLIAPYTFHGGVSMSSGVLFKDLLGDRGPCNAYVGDY